MDKKIYTFDDFLDTVIEDYKEFVQIVHAELSRRAYKIKIEEKASGLLLTYKHPQTKRSLINFLFRKKGLMVRLYPKKHMDYIDLIKDLPEEMEKQIAKAADCAKLSDPGACNPKCGGGYYLPIKDRVYEKCYYCGFFLIVNEQSIPFFEQMIKFEVGEL